MITLNTSYSTYNYNRNTNRKNVAYNPAFSGLLPASSAFSKPFEKCTDKLTDGIAKYFLTPLMSSKPAQWLDKQNDAGHIVDHMQTLGSCVVTGMYMTQTLRNKEMDKDRKKTLAINQGLTLVASNIIAHLFSRKLEKSWDKNISMKYAGWRLGLSKEEVAQNLKQYQINDAKSYYNRHKDYDALKEYKKQFDKYLKTDKKLADYIKAHPDEEALKILTTKADFNKNKGYKNFKVKNLVGYIEKGLHKGDIAKELKGLNIFKSLLIFTSVFRFIGPVAVTPIANWIADKFIHNDAPKANAKADTKTEPAADTKDAKSTDNKVVSSELSAFSTPMMAKFLGGNK